MTHTNDAQCRPVRLDQYVNHDPPAYIRDPACIHGRPLLVQLRQTPGLYPRPGLYLRPGLYSRKYGTYLFYIWQHLQSHISVRKWETKLQCKTMPRI